MAKVQVLNTGLRECSVSVNNGGQFNIAGANGQTFVPGFLTNGGPDLGHYPQPGIFAPGSNHIAVSLQGSSKGYEVRFPGNQQIISAQLYLFFSGNSPDGYVLLVNGEKTSSSL